MTQSRELLLVAAVAALSFGVTRAPLQMQKETPLLDSFIVVATDDAAPDADAGAPAQTDEDAAQTTQGSGKMGEEPGTHTGPDQGVTPENDTAKVDQPARRNPTTGTPGDEGAPGQ